jgi:hypothetical protein
MSGTASIASPLLVPADGRCSVSFRVMPSPESSPVQFVHLSVSSDVFISLSLTRLQVGQLVAALLTADGELAEREVAA